MFVEAGSNEYSLGQQLSLGVICALALTHGLATVSIQPANVSFKKRIVQAFPRHICMLWLVVLGSVPLLFVIPSWTSNQVGGSFMANLRHVPLTLCAITLLGASHPVWQTRLRHGILLMLAIASGLCVTGVGSLSRELTTQLGTWPAVNVLAKNSKMAVSNEPLSLTPGGHLFRTHLSQLAFADHLAWSGGVFEGYHMPVIARDKEGAERRQKDAKRIVSHLIAHGDTPTAPWSQAFWSDCNLIWVQVDALGTWLPASPKTVSVLARGSRWALLGPPIGDLPVGAKSAGISTGGAP
jgi:hypothetical protein